MKVYTFAMPREPSMINTLLTCLGRIAVLSMVVPGELQDQNRT